MAHPKGLLMERLKKLGIGKPEFRTANTGPEHQPTFLSDVLVNGEVYGTGQGPTKREAERLAAEEALAYLDRAPDDFDEAEEIEDPGTTEDSRRKAGDEVDTRLQTRLQGSELQGSEESDEDGRFEGPWPVFEHLLTAALTIANDRTEVRLSGAEARTAVREFALELYKELLEDLGDVVEDTDEDSDQDGA